MVGGLHLPYGLSLLLVPVSAECFGVVVGCGLTVLVGLPIAAEQ